MQRIRTGIIGFGHMAEGHHLTRLQETGLFSVVGVCDITESRRKAAEEKGLKATANLDEFLSWDTEFVVIATHSSHHLEPAVSAARAGKHILVEKPIAPTAQEAETMAAAAEENGVTFAVYHNRHFDPDYRMVKAAYEDGLLGNLITVENRSFGPRPAHTFGTPDFDPGWRITSGSGGGALLDFGPHWVEQILDLMGDRKVVQVFGDVRHIKWGDADDVFSITMVFDDGARATAGKADVAYAGPGTKWFVIGTEATLTGPLREGDAVSVAVHGPGFEMKRTKAVEAQSIHANVAAHIRDGVPLIVPPEHALRVMRVLQAGRDSAEAGRSVDTDI